MKLVVQKRSFFQYLMLYIVLICGWSTLYWKNSDIAPIVIAAICIFVKIVTRQSWKKYKEILFVCIFSGFIVMNHIILGNDAGLGTILEFCVPLLVVDTYIHIDKTKAVYRFINGIYVYAIVSLLFTAVAVFMPQVLNNIFSDVDMYCGNMLKGSLIYTYQGATVVRNCGLYTEPGLFHIVLNAAIFLLLYTVWGEQFGAKRGKMLIVLSIAVLTTLSATGILTLGVVLLGSTFVKSKDRKKIIVLSMAIIVTVIIDYFVRDTESVLYGFVFSKFAQYGQSSVWGNLNSIDARLRAIEVVQYALSVNIFGVGGSTFANYMRKFDLTTLAGNGLFRWLAVLGVHVWLLLLFYIFGPMIKQKVEMKKIIIFAVVYVLFTITQLYMFIPILLLIPKFLIMEKQSFQIVGGMYHEC